MKVTMTPPSRSMRRRGVGFCYREKDGGLVLLGDATWRKINGVYLNTARGCWWLEFRHHG